MGLGFFVGGSRTRMYVSRARVCGTCCALVCAQDMSRVHVNMKCTKKNDTFPVHYPRVIVCCSYVFVCYLYCYSYVLVCHSYVFVCHSNLLVCTCALSVCYWHVSAQNRVRWWTLVDDLCSVRNKED